MANIGNSNFYCRTCAKIFQRQPLIPLYRYSNPAIDAIRNYQNFKFQISRDDGLPQQVCSQCLNKFNAMNEFIELCEQSQVILKQIFSLDFGIEGDEEFVLKSEPESDDYENEEFLLDEFQTPSSPTEEYKVEIVGNESLEIESNPVKSNHENSIDKLSEDLQNDEIGDDHDIHEISKEESEFICEVCGKHFRSFEVLLSHEKLHSNKSKKSSNVMCEICGEVMDWSKMSKHLIFHKGQNNYFKCEHCEKEFSKYKTFALHVKMKHLITPKFYCQLCDRGFKMECNLRTHMRFGHANQNQKQNQKQNETTPKKKVVSKPRPKAHLQCLYCMKKFHNTVSLVIHCQSHSKVDIAEAKFVCSYCKATFKRADHLKLHVNSQHLKSEQFKCQFCDKIFYASFVLNRHVKHKHSAEKKERVNCDLCNKSLMNDRYLVRHKQEFHSTEKHLKCPICDERFYRRVELTAHSKVHDILIDDEDNKEAILKEIITESVAGIQNNCKIIEEKIIEEYNEDVEVQVLMNYEDFEEQ